MTFLTKHVRDCVDACYKTVLACERAADASDDANTRALARECADLAAICMRFVERESRFAADLAAVCVRACRTTATACQNQDDAVHMECTNAARACAKILTDNALVLGAFKQARLATLTPGADVRN